MELELWKVWRLANVHCKWRLVYFNYKSQEQRPPGSQSVPPLNENILYIFVSLIGFCCSYIGFFGPPGLLLLSCFFIVGVYDFFRFFLPSEQQISPLMLVAFNRLRQLLSSPRCLIPLLCTFSPCCQAPCENLRTPSTYPGNMLPHHPGQGNFEDFTCWAQSLGASQRALCNQSRPYNEDFLTQGWDECEELVQSLTEAMFL